MDYQQRGRLLVPIKTQVIPVGDLGLPIGGVSDLNYPDDLPSVLAVNAIQTPSGPRIVQAGTDGQITSRPVKNVVLVGGLALTATQNFLFPDLTNAQNFTVYLVLGTTSGTTPTMQIVLQGSFDGGATFVTLLQTTNLTTVGQTALIGAGVGASNTTLTGVSLTAAFSYLFPAICRLRLVIGGTTPSFVTTAIAAIR